MSFGETFKLVREIWELVGFGWWLFFLRREGGAEGEEGVSGGVLGGCSSEGRCLYRVFICVKFCLGFKDRVGKRIF